MGLLRGAQGRCSGRIALRRRHELPHEGEVEHPSEFDLVSLQESLTPLEKHFNEHGHLHRLLAVLSPT
jgi:hypothetical protein